MNKEQRIEEAKRLRASGMTYQAIGDALGVSLYHAYTLCHPERATQYHQANKDKAYERQRSPESRERQKEYRNRPEVRQRQKEHQRRYRASRLNYFERKALHEQREAGDA